MHIHILGICGTFMGGLAVLAKAAGHKVTGCDANVYPPMSTQLEVQGIDLVHGYDAAQTAINPDLFIIGNVVSRGNALMEAILNRGLPYMSGPEWMGRHILQDKWVLAVAGTHGKTTTSSMLAWILEDAGYSPGFLIGGVPNNFGISARLGKDNDISPFFVMEADEYDTAFFDKRSKFVHYHAKTAVLNNLEFDHADIFPDIGAIEMQFHHFVRTLPGNGQLIVNQREAALKRVLDRGCWSEVVWFGGDAPRGWTLGGQDEQIFDVLLDGERQGTVRWELTGEHNRLNALAAIAAARHVGVMPAQAISALSGFRNVRRRMELRGEAGGVRVYDDFAHHPTAIATTLAGLRRKTGADAKRERIIAVLEPRSNTMKLGVMKQALPESLKEADLVFGYGALSGKDALGWDLEEALLPLAGKAAVFHDLDKMVADIVRVARPGDHILVMSNGGFGNVHEKLLDRLRTGAPS
ncbi:MAG: UDP-N-acetylmuramate:L-alanyl-gamma-D-glutamyl-meso-diaminopimelate ligase [Burkholderiaceae bacterium]|jgi:UDP-N-acetylmuramate: L-alanyl-gamma-D-glutamyl-meso-diaminopimelate ligase|nr:UDP-N-acetylmuramate:L-alanyl-gamma-D-glutamyl-meso-diaminopimelate ligase [Burkholderiaceae bacterium]